MDLSNFFSCCFWPEYLFLHLLARISNKCHFQIFDVIKNQVYFYFDFFLHHFGFLQLSKYWTAILKRHFIILLLLLLLICFYFYFFGRMRCSSLQFLKRIQAICFKIWKSKIIFSIPNQRQLWPNYNFDIVLLFPFSVHCGE